MKHWQRISCSIRSGRFVAFCAILVACCLVTAGCGGGAGYDVAPVSGKVTLGGEPVANVLVTFQPTGGGEDPGPGSAAKTGADGSFTLNLIAAESKPGAVVGSHKVTLVEQSDSVGGEEDDSGGEPVVYKLPESARDGSTTFEVPAEGTSAANFEF